MRPNNRLILAIAIFIFASCTTLLPMQLPVNRSTCSQPGTIGHDKVSHPSAGFVITFQYYLPPCYAEQKTSRFPVIYFITIIFEGRLDDQANTPMSLADRLIRTGKMPPSILIVPDEINTIPERQYRGVGGISSGGAVAARMAFQFPNEFGSLGILSGGITTGEKVTFENWISTASSSIRPRVRIDVGDQDGIMPLTQNLANVLDQNNVPYTLNIGHGNHDWTFWSGRIESYLLWFAEAWK